MYVVVEIGTDFGFDGEHEYGYDTVEECYGPFRIVEDAERWAKKKKHFHYKVVRLNSVE